MMKVANITDRSATATFSARRRSQRPAFWNRGFINRSLASALDLEEFGAG
jgi:hypothetical protein